MKAIRVSRATHRQRTYNLCHDSQASGLSNSCLPSSRDKAPSFRVHDQYQFPSSASYDNQQLKKLDAKRTLDNRSPPRGSVLSSSMRSLQDAPASWANGDRPHIQLPQLSLPTRTKPGPILESPRYTDTPLNSAVSPRSTPFAQVSRPQEYRSSPIEPNSAIDSNKSPYARSRRHNSSAFPDDLTPADSYDQELEFPLEETSRLRQFHIDEGQHSRMNSFDNQSVVSLKRRASSPPVEDGALRHVSSQGDLLRRREGTSRGSPAPRLSLNPPHGSISSLSSGDRSGSLGGLSTATSMTSSLSFGRRSPIGLSPTETATSPFAAPNSLTLSPRSTIIPRTSVHQRGPSDQRNMVSPRKLTEPTLRTPAGVGKIQGFYMCDCCPKKPKKFDTRDELR